MSTPYYEDEFVTLWHGDCLEILPTIDRVDVAALLTDPPYFNVKPDAWDRQWKQRDDFLSWLGDVVDLTAPLLAASASVWMFASPELTSMIETQVIAPRFRVLNSIRWVKEAGWHQKAEIASLRGYLAAWEGIIFAERFDDVYGETSKALHREVFAPLGRYLQAEWERAGWKAGRLGVALGYDSALPTRWAEGSSLPTADAYQRMRELLNAAPGDYLRREYEDLRREYEDLRREYEDLRRPFNLNRQTGPVEDVWTYHPVLPYPGKHPCEKPLPMLEHMVTASTRPGDTVLDPFMGSGSAVVAAKNLGRKAIGVELDERYCEITANRLAQNAFDFGASA